MNKKQQGMTLIEVLAAITILSIIIIVLMNTLGFTTLAFSKSEQKVQALSIAEQELNLKLHELETATPPLTVCTTQCTQTKTLNRNGRTFEVNIVESSVAGQPVYNFTSKNPYVTLQGVGVMNNGTAYEQRLITVNVAWER